MLGDVWSALFRRPATVKYPFVKRAPPARLRGVLQYDPEQCTGCGMCAQDCPAEALELITLDKKNKQFVLRYHIDRCTFCAQCVQSCKFRCLDMSPDQWELAAKDKVPFTVYYGRDKDIETVLERRVGADAAPAQTP
jgi:formate hydrogenlyase subunit 6/NADH:ubiquinone oxidoreductase subunit I